MMEAERLDVISTIRAIAANFYICAEARDLSIQLYHKYSKLSNSTLLTSDKCAIPHALAMIASKLLDLVPLRTVSLCLHLLFIGHVLDTTYKYRIHSVMRYMRMSFAYRRRGWLESSNTYCFHSILMYSF
jgi:hypothetical protein